MRGYVAVTDPGWYECLLREGVYEANFWRPSTRRVNLAPGTPFFFKLKAPANAIAGFGYFAHFTVLPEWLAWDTFGRANGVPSHSELRARLRRIRDGARIDADPQDRIGCSLLAECRFFPREAWVKPPADWSPRTQTGASVDLRVGDGRRIWAECLERSSFAAESLTAAEKAAPISAAAGHRYGAPTMRRPRLGQGIFRVQVLDAYERACAVTGEHSLPALDAAHIRPYADGGSHDIDNGLALRSDLHRLFDRGYVSVDDELRFLVSRRLKDDFDNGRSYYGYQSQPLLLPATQSLRPDRAALAWHRENVFLG
ncbi:MAG: HNH endonuclease [Myxococcales bacterium]|nr:HNH endonuclease [Myxococcales bacterium]MCB9707133.1 HNH endonuclease [Myxococcales bacterium]